MSYLYPSLEDMVVDHIAQAQVAQQQQAQPSINAPGYQPPPPTVHVYPQAPHPQGYSNAPPPQGYPHAPPPQGYPHAPPPQSMHYAPPPQTMPTAPPFVSDRAPPQIVPGPYSLYPSLHDYMGLDLSAPDVADYMKKHQVVPAQTQAVEKRGACNVVAPVSGVANKEIQRSEIKQGIREIIVCKGTDNKVGMSVRAINKGVFCGYVRKDSPAAIAGLRFGDQILQIDGATCAGWTADQFNKAVKSANPKKISLAVRDRPFERMITMQKDSQGHIGFGFKDGEISHIVKDSSAARNGVLINHNLVEVNGQNVVGLKDKEVQKMFADAPRTLAITIMPDFIFKVIMKNMADSFKKSMDHSIPDV